MLFSQHKDTLYLNYLTIVFFLAYGFIMLDASGVTFVSDVLMSELGITVSQYSFLSSIVWCTKAFSSIFIGFLASRTVKRKIFLSPLLILAGILSILVALTNSFKLILIFKFCSGFCIGASLSMMVSIVQSNLIKKDLGSRSGFISCGSAVISSACGPIILNWLAINYSWRGVFIFTGSVLFLVGSLIQFSVKEIQNPEIKKVTKTTTKLPITRLFTNRCFLLCLFLGVFETAGKMIITIFAPVYLTSIVGVETSMKGVILSLMGIFYIPFSFLIPALADRYSPSKIMCFTFIVCTLFPISILLFSGSTVSVICLILCGNLAAATVSIFIYLIPGEILEKELVSSANGIIMGCSIFFGGFLFPSILGTKSNNQEGIINIFIVCLAVFIICIVLSLWIDRLRKRSSK